MTHDVLKKAIDKKGVLHANVRTLVIIGRSLDLLSGLNEMEQHSVENIRKELHKIIRGQNLSLVDTNGFIKDLLAEMTEIKGGKQ